MEDTLIKAFNKMNDTNYRTLNEIQVDYSKEEIFNSYLRSIGIIGYTRDILNVVELIKRQ